jgi:hypothetical protein
MKKSRTDVLIKMIQKIYKKRFKYKTNLLLMIQLSSVQSHNLLQRLPKIELSYEIIPHKKVSNNYNVCIAIPCGIKCYAWFTFYGEDDVCFIMEINKEKKINKVSYFVLEKTMTHQICLGTLLYGTFIEKQFIIEDIFVYKGMNIQNLYYGEKLGFLENMFILINDKYTHLNILNGTPEGVPLDVSIPINQLKSTVIKDNRSNSNVHRCKKWHITFHLPVMWGMYNKNEYECIYDIPSKYSEKYPVHHIQYRCLSYIAPYLNVYPVKKGFGMSSIQLSNPCEINTPFRHDFSKSQYKQLTVFKVTADLQYDVYNLFCYGRNKSSIFYNFAYIPNYNTSIYMNNIFRKIKENENLDAIEESDDEEDFENIDYDKYVDLKKYVFMECKFSMKFKKWIPIRVVQPEQKVVHFTML